MQERLDFIKLQPAHWIAWEPVRSGLNTLRLVAARYDKATWHAVVTQPQERKAAQMALQAPWWKLSRWTRPAVFAATAPDATDASTGTSAAKALLPLAQMVWANMLLHQAADPQALMAQWHRALAVDGFVMFSCLGPDTLRELRSAYAAQGWPAPAHEFTDMHDWGDMLVEAGFAEPVMDMERITLSYASPQRLLAELRELGRNFHVQRFAGLRGKRWHAQLLNLLQTLARPEEDGRLVLTFEVVYGHALKPQPRAKVQAVSQIDLHDMRAMLRKDSKI
jgi:malonyl-CoA O-methyltransferase